MMCITAALVLSRYAVVVAGRMSAPPTAVSRPSRSECTTTAGRNPSAPNASASTMGSSGPDPEIQRRTQSARRRSRSLRRDRSAEEAVHGVDRNGAPSMARSSVHHDHEHDDERGAGQEPQEIHDQARGRRHAHIVVTSQDTAGPDWSSGRNPPNERSIRTHERFRRSRHVSRWTGRCPNPSGRRHVETIGRMAAAQSPHRYIG